MTKGKLSPKRIEKLIKMGRLVPLIQQNKEGKPFLAGYTRKATSRKRYQRFLLPQEDVRMHIFDTSGIKEKLQEIAPSANFNQSVEPNWPLPEKRLIELFDKE